VVPGYRGSIFDLQDFDDSLILSNQGHQVNQENQGSDIPVHQVNHEN
jgi:hypothetical protein